jgi:hypothetical protein
LSKEQAEVSCRSIIREKRKPGSGLRGKSR